MTLYKVQTYVCLGRGNAELYESNLGLLNPPGSIHICSSLCKHKPINQLCVLHSATKLLDDSNVLWRLYKELSCVIWGSYSGQNKDCVFLDKTSCSLVEFRGIHCFHLQGRRKWRLRQHGPSKNISKLLPEYTHYIKSSMYYQFLLDCIHVKPPESLIPLEPTRKSMPAAKPLYSLAYF